MTTVSRGIPEHPHLDVPKREARELLNQCRKGERDALERIRRRHPKFDKATDDAIVSELKLSDTQLVIAREYGLSNWTILKQRIAENTAAGALREAIRSDDRDAVMTILRASPEMLHLPVWSGNWGPPMSHAANLGRLEIIKACAELGARDYQHAFGRALLQGQVECAEWLHAHGATLAPGIIMGSCETLNVAGFKFLLDAGAAITDGHGDRMAPLALVLETYSRHPSGKHAILKLFAERGYHLPDTPIMALHRGDIARLEQHLHRNPLMLERRFSLQEIYPAECGCAPNGLSGLHWTPINGTTLLHLAIDFREREIFEWLLMHGADVNARAMVDSDGFGGHTPLFNTVVGGPGSDATMARTLLERGAERDARASLRKFLDWIADPRWYEARNVTPAEWGHGFPEKNWVNIEVLRVVDSA
ncbi:ankyrin repeat domain-containing protein [Edaphobacter albus]|uniref:ankyrin repeat domain-containing protein n=1 Tax=Edaphobacter sp. 4G125 TaxID=2763071 RepID=UPI00164526A6|nr:ankyrin repeat domain-containing protein [Edaphobacter sp. 4G125]QNI36429.1 ankyrin repeat domain-containing protein [Edaphobacter sp. 4G125]